MLESIEGKELPGIGAFRKNYLKMRRVILMTVFWFFPATTGLKLNTFQSQMVI